jgi:hypothetical protein
MMLKQNLMAPGHHLVDFVKFLFRLKKHKFGLWLELYHIFVYDFYKHMEVFTRPIHHAEEEFYGPGH